MAVSPYQLPDRSRSAPDLQPTASGSHCAGRPAGQRPPAPGKSAQSGSGSAVGRTVSPPESPGRTDGEVHRPVLPCLPSATPVPRPGQPCAGEHAGHGITARPCRLALWPHDTIPCRCLPGRQLPRHPGADEGYRQDRRGGCPGPHHGGVRHRQGADGEAHPHALCSADGPLQCDQLRRPARRADPVGALRSREGGLHRRRPAQGRHHRVVLGRHPLS